MTLHYFPTIYPDEHLYSLVARYRIHLGSPSFVQINQELLGKRIAVASLEFQCGIDHLSKQISNMSPEKIIDEMTLFNYYVSHTNNDLAGKMKAKLLKGDSNKVYIKLGYPIFSVERVSRLRFCVKCKENMLIKYGELYWRRTHQLPSVFICKEHQISLRLSSVDMKKECRFAYIHPTELNCPDDAELLVPEHAQNDYTFYLLNQLIEHSEKALEPKSGKRSLTEWSDFYRDKIEDTVFAKGQKTKIIEINEAFKSFYKNDLNWLTGFNTDHQSEWVSSIARTHKTHFHPLQHFLFQIFLDSAQPCHKPFGKGPWECVNPLADHYKEKIIKTHSRVKNPRANSLIATFSCTCGYKYTRSFFYETSQVTPPRFKEYGPLFEPALLLRVRNRQTLDLISEELGIDRITVIKIARREDIPNPWDSGWVKAVPKVKLKKNDVMEPCKKTKRPATWYLGRKSKVDWKSVDLELETKVKKAVNELSKITPPVKINLPAIERHIGVNTNWLYMRLKHLHKTSELVNSNIETHLRFQERRVTWAITECKTNGISLATSNVLRMAGLQSSAKHVVERVLIEAATAQRT